VIDDVLVVGAGPAGSTAARELALAGARVRVLDRARFPRNKPCGGAVSARALTRFPWLQSALQTIPVRSVSRLHLEGPAGTSVELTSSRPAVLMVRRYDFDALLVRLAVEAGAELIEGVEMSQAEARPDGVVLRSRDGHTWRAARVIAADGVYSVIARRIGLNAGWAPSHVALDMMEETPSTELRETDPSSMWVAYGYGGQEGYAYVFPKVGYVNVGLGFVLNDYRSRIARPPFDLQAAFVSKLRQQGVLTGASSRAHFTPYQIPVGGPLRRTATDRVLLAGDAGGFVNGVTAEGIYYAMVSGALAAGALAGQGPRAYERAWRAEIGAELGDAVLIQRYLLGRPERIDRAVAGATQRPALPEALIAYGMGDRTYRSARRALIRSLPGFGLSLGLLALRGSARRSVGP
jgi:geranylgeranyl reductase family protein